MSILGSHLSEQPPGRPPDDNAILNRRKGRDMSQPEPSRSRLVLHHKLWILRGARFGYYAGWKGGRESRGNPRVRHSGSGIRTLGPPSAATPSATANHLSSHHLPRQLGLRFAPKASNPSRKSSDLRRPVFKIEPKPRRQLHDPLLPAKRRTGHVVLGIDRLTSHAAQMDLPRPGPEEVFPRGRGEGRLDPRVPDAKCHFLRQA